MKPVSVAPRAGHVRRGSTDMTSIFIAAFIIIAAAMAAKGIDE